MNAIATAIVLAAGESRRMGDLKPLLPYGGGTVIQAVVRALQASPVRHVVVVVGHRAEEISANLAGTSAECVFNPRFAEGMLSSIRTGLTAAPEETEWFVIALGDQPALKPALVAALVRAAQERGKGIVVPSYGGRRGHPLVIHASLRQEIAELDPALGLRELLRRHPEAVHHVVVGDEAVLADMDTPEDYRRELQRLQTGDDGPGA